MLLCKLQTVPAKLLIFLKLLIFIIPLSGTSGLPMISPGSCFPIKILFRSYHTRAGPLAEISLKFAEIIGWRDENFPYKHTIPLTSMNKVRKLSFGFCAPFSLTLFSKLYVGTVKFKSAKYVVNSFSCKKIKRNANIAQWLCCMIEIYTFRWR